MGAVAKWLDFAGGRPHVAVKRCPLPREQGRKWGQMPRVTGYRHRISQNHAWDWLIGGT